MKQINTVTKVVEKEEITAIYCNKCGKNLGDQEFQIKGGMFEPIFCWTSQYDCLNRDLRNMQPPKILQIDMCDDCWAEFFNSLKINPIKIVEDYYKNYKEDNYDDE